MARDATLFSRYRAHCKRGRLRSSPNQLQEKIKVGKIRRALVTILDDEVVTKSESMVGSIEIIDDDLESGSREIANLFNESLGGSDMKTFRTF